MAWHADRTLVQTPESEVKKLTVDEFIELDKTTIFKKNTGYEKVVKLDKQGNPVKDKKGNPVYKAGKKNGWLVEQGGYPPLAFGFSRRLVLHQGQFGPPLADRQRRPLQCQSGKNSDNEACYFRIQGFYDSL